jgi:uncharacterized membrane protein (UPF0182 family)
MLRRKKIVILILVIFLVLPFFFSLTGLYTDWLFFKETGFPTVFTTTLLARIGSGVFFAIITFAFVLINAVIANRAKFPPAHLYAAGGSIRSFSSDEAALMAKPLSIIAAVVLAFLAGQWGAAQWEKILLFKNMITVGINDPVLGKDIGFYLFSLPLIETVKSSLTLLVLVAAVMVAAIYYMRGGVTISPRGPNIDRRVLRHLAILAGVFMLLVSAGFWLDGFRLLFSANGAVYGAGYADVNSRLQAYRLLSILTPIGAVVLAAGIWRGSWRKALLAPAAILLVYGAGIKAYPAFLQKFQVAPNELALELPYIANNIKFTRLGYDLDKIQTIPFNVENKLSAADIAANSATIKNIRLWDHAPLLRTFSQLQQIRTYYKFFDVDNDRYTVNGQYTQVMLSPRELSYSDLPSKTWINERLIFTHGNGLTIGPVSSISREGLPEFFVKDIPAVSLADIKVTRPEIYYGELSNDYVIVRTKVPEFGYPTATGNINATYEGTGGVPLDSFLKKVLFSLRFGTEKILLSSAIRPESRIMYYRNVKERISAVTPFLTVDEDPYMVVAKDGRLKWIVDAYTVSKRLPCSQPLAGGINYMRNSVKVVVDAYDGSLDYYISDPGDVMVKVYARIFPGLFKPLTAMPEDLRRHIRYPHRFLQVQAAMFAAYHMTDPKVFYNKENLWEVPVIGEKMMEPYYTIMKLPGEQKEEYILLLPFTPAKRDNLAAWLTARCDGPDYGKLLAYTFSRDKLVYGPKQIDARINQDSYISQQITLWNQHGSEVIRGSMLVIPIEKSLLYVQPLYLAAADKSGLPELRRVIVAYGDQVVMEENLELALRKLFGGKSSVAEVPGVSEEKAATGVGGLPREALAIFERATEKQRRGDWAGYGEELRKLQEVLQRMAK